MSSRGAPARPLSERGIDGACLVFATWTVACHVCVLAGASLWAATGVFLLFGAALAFVWRTLEDPTRPGSVTAESGTGQRAEWVGRVILLLASGVAAWQLHDQPVVLWWVALVILGAAALIVVRRDAALGAAARTGRALELALWVAAVACALLALTAHRPDLDDAYYLNVAVAAADAPWAALYAGDTLHGVPDLPIHHPIYRVHSWELWNALLSRLTGLSVIASFHFVSAALAAALVPLAWARLFRRLAPANWLAPVLAVLFVLIVVGDLHRGYANFAFVRIWQGKSILLSVLLPVVASAAIDFARFPSLRRGLLLGGAQIAALGCSSSALWAAPAVSLASGLCALPWSARSLRTLALLALASCYVLGAGLLMRGVLNDDFADRRATVETQELEALVVATEEKRALRHAPGLQLEEATALVLGEGGLASLGVFALLGTWALLPAGLGRRYACVVPLAVWFVLFNPYWTDAISRGAVGNSYWRVFWALPIPALCALGLTAPLAWLPNRWVGAGLSLLLGFAFAQVPAHSALAPENDVRLGLPGYKVPADAYRAAQLFTERVPGGSIVVAPRPVSAWLPTFEERTAPLLVREPYLRRYRPELGNDDLYHRVLMTDFVSGIGTEPDAARHFVRGLERYAVAGVLLSVTPRAATARTALRGAGFAKVLATLDYEIWARE